MVLEILTNNMTIKRNIVVNGILVYCMSCEQPMDRSGWRHLCLKCATDKTIDSMHMWHKAVEIFPELKYT